MRTGGSFLAWLVAVVAAVVTIPTLWLATHVADEQGYVDFTSSFVDDTELQQALAAQVADDVATQSGLPAPAAKAIETGVATVAAQVAQQPGFTTAWEESQRRTHRLTFDDDADRLTVDLGPIASFLVKQVSDSLPVRIDVPATLKVPVYDAPDRATLDRVADTPGQSRIGLAVVAIAALLCLLLARRRATALAGLGLGAVLSGVLLIAATGLAVPEVLDRTPARTPFAREMRDLLVDRAGDSLQAWCVVVAIAGVIALVIGLVLRAVSGARP